MWTQTHEGREALFPHEDAFYNINTPKIWPAHRR